MIDTTSAFPVSRASSIPTVSAAEMAEVDGLAIDEFGIDLLQMIEQAGSHLADPLLPAYLAQIARSI